MAAKKIVIKEVLFPKKADRVDFFKAAVLYILSDSNPKPVFVECERREESELENPKVKNGSVNIGNVVEILKYFECINAAFVETPDVEVVEPQKVCCVKCGKELNENQIAVYQRHPEREMLCKQCELEKRRTK